ncbi:M23 family metallopeptidase [Streptomyces endophytica]|uniref:Peptidoglycan DD-metalloendopeptidase family protein n=1 Tax=Streptomyces endophytica TaxID=2991496 RepID=A0ABY6P860_9ACTN|nr:peptidoglycan DD-metalloendopeptidase family protein [Streptomyces endophytica]UZJ29966.1 peptidoglycan DD-metalloendopeptidase family protein [Streptomyces endophytica]
MNDRHPSEATLPTGSASDASYAPYPAYESYGQQHSPAGGAEYGDGDPLFGSLPGAYDTGAHATGGYDTGGYPGGTYDTGAYDMSTYGTGSYGTGDYGTGTYPAAGDGYATGGYETGGYPTAQWDSGAYDPYAHTSYETPAQDPSGYDTHGATVYGVGGYDTGSYPTTGYDTGSYPAGAYDAYGTTGGYETVGAHEAYGTTVGYDALGQQAAAVEESAAFEMAAFETATFDAVGVDARNTDQLDTASYEATAIWSTTDQPLMSGIPAQPGPPPADSVAWDDRDDTGGLTDDAHDGDAAAVAEAPTQAMPVTSPAPAPASRRVAGPAAGKPVRGRGRRRPAKRSALLTVAVPSVAAMGVCGVAAASVAGLGGNDKDDTTTQASAPDPGGVQRTAANKKLDTQLAGLSAGADDFRDRASRTQERLDLKERQAQERKRKAEEAARKEAMRPKFVLPVTQHGLSALFGQAGVNWMSVHTGIDFPVSYGTPVMSATDGTIRTQWNSAYGNMAIVTAPDGTETWYCHLSSTKIRSGSVKAGEQIAYSGNSGNSTGPHLHFEVRPGGGAAVDPIPWLRSHGLNPN